MKFCPNCGSKREEEKICNCGYNYETGETEEKEVTPLPGFTGMKGMDNYIGMPHRGEVTLKDLKEKKFDVGNLLNVSFSSSGGMMGMYFSENLSFETNELTVIDKEWHHGPKTQTIYKTDKKTVEELKKLIIDNNLVAWSELPIDPSMFAYDAPTAHMNLKFENYSANISTQVTMNQEERDIFFKVKELIASFIKEENVIKEETLEEGQNFATQINGMIQTFCPDCGRVMTTNTCECGYKKSTNN